MPSDLVSHPLDTNYWLSESKSLIGGREQNYYKTYYIRLQDCPTCKLAAISNVHV